MALIFEYIHADCIAGTSYLEGPEIDLLMDTEPLAHLRSQRLFRTTDEVYKELAVENHQHG